MIEPEFHWARSIASQSVKKKEWVILDTDPLTLDAWRTYRAVIAPVLSDKDWTTMVVAAFEVAHIKQQQTTVGQAGRKVEDDELEKLKRNVSNLEDAIKILGGLTGEPLSGW